MTNYKNKYLKYKLKYQKLIGGMENNTLAFFSITRSNC